MKIEKLHHEEISGELHRDASSIESIIDTVNQIIEAVKSLTEPAEKGYEGGAWFCLKCKTLSVHLGLKCVSCFLTEPAEKEIGGHRYSHGGKDLCCQPAEKECCGTLPDGNGWGHSGPCHQEKDKIPIEDYKNNVVLGRAKRTIAIGTPVRIQDID
jgi:hypothetical protein